MSRVCDLTGLRPITGNNVSHSNNRTKRRFLPNLHKKKFYIPETDQWVTLKVSSKALRNIDKMGLYDYARKQQAAGIKLPFELGKKK